MPIVPTTDVAAIRRIKYIEMMMKDHNEVADLTVQAPRRALWRRILLPRFSLRTMLVLVTFISVSAAYIGNCLNNTWRQQRALETIVQSFGVDSANLATPSAIQLLYDYEYEKEFDGNDAVSWSDSHVPDFLLPYFNKDHFHNVIYARLTLSESILKDDDKSNILKILAGLPKLQILKCAFYAKEYDGSEQLRLISEMKELKELSLYSDKWLIGREEVGHLKKLPNLRSLELAWQSLDSDMTALSELNNLEELGLLGSDISPKRLQELKPLVKLRVFSVCEYDSPSLYPQGMLSASQIRSITKQFPNLEALHLYNYFAAKDLEPLNKMPNLKKLYVNPFVETKELSQVIPKIEISPKK